MMANPSRSQVILSFDVEEHWRIEAAARLRIDEARRAYYADRVAEPTTWLLDQLAKHEIKATFFVVGQLAKAEPRIVAAIHAAGHEVASHSWEHRRVHNFSPAAFRDDVRRSKDVLEQITGTAVVGYRAPTFSVVRQTAWALEVLAEEDFLYDSSVYPVRHDRYGVADAPRWPFRASVGGRTLLELPPARLDCLGLRVPAGGGGYFRLFPLGIVELALRQIARRGAPPVAMLYFHPWEFDPGQERLPLGRLGRFRTYVGVDRTRAKLGQLLSRHRFSRAADVARGLSGKNLVEFCMDSHRGAECIGNVPHARIEATE